MVKNLEVLDPLDSWIPWLWFRHQAVDGIDRIDLSAVRHRSVSPLSIKTCSPLECNLVHPNRKRFQTLFPLLSLVYLLHLALSNGWRREVSRRWCTAGSAKGAQWQYSLPQYKK